MELWDAGIVTCLEQGADLHMAQLMPLLLTVSVTKQYDYYQSKGQWLERYVCRRTGHASQI